MLFWINGEESRRKFALTVSKICGLCFLSSCWGPVIPNPNNHKICDFVIACAHPPCLQTKLSLNLLMQAGNLEAAIVWNSGFRIQMVHGRKECSPDACLLLNVIQMVDIWSITKSYVIWGPDYVIVSSLISLWTGCFVNASFLISGKSGIIWTFFKLQDKYRSDLPPFQVLFYQFIYSAVFIELLLCTSNYDRCQK